ncbi:MAG: Holliday junction branch migration protein RuvA [Patescibacteria group bacterium]
MLAYIQGTIISKEGQSIIIDVGGLGYRVAVTDAFNHSHALGTKIALHLHYHLRENTAELYGFHEQRELGLFAQLLAISGIGPKTALGILNACTVDAIHRAVGMGDAGLLKTLSGIGSKTAERIIIELKGKLHGIGLSQSAHTQNDTDIIDALVSLGYSQIDACTAVFALDTTIEGVEARLKAALKTLGKSAR